MELLQVELVLVQAQVVEAVVVPVHPELQAVEVETRLQVLLHQYLLVATLRIKIKLHMKFALLKNLVQN